MNKIKSRLKSWLGIDNAEIHMNECALRIEKLEDLVKVGVDVGRRGDSWAVICMAGKAEYVKFVTIKDKDARELRQYLQQFKARNVIMDLPGGISRELFLKRV